MKMRQLLTSLLMITDIDVLEADVKFYIKGEDNLVDIESIQFTEEGEIHFAEEDALPAANEQAQDQAFAEPETNVEETGKQT